MEQLRLFEWSREEMQNANIEINLDVVQILPNGTRRVVFHQGAEAIVPAIGDKRMARRTVKKMQMLLSELYDSLTDK